MLVENKPAVIAIVGPTCTGKTDLSISLAQKLNGEIVALDSRTIYKKMDIGTAKPTIEQQNKIKHYAIDIVEPKYFFTVAEYLNIAINAINTIIKKGKLPILCGGTGLYARALLEGIQMPTVQPKLELRAELNSLADQKGNTELYTKLVGLDPVTAGRLNINDRRRIIRALEVCLTTGKPFSQLATKVDLPFRTTWIGLNWNDRSMHKKIITQRFEKHLAAGLLKEVSNLWQNNDYRPVLSNSVNYKEFIPYIEQKTSLEEVQEECIKNNFQLARKQMIWFRARSFINWIQFDEFDLRSIMDKSLKMLPDYLLHT
jgi:tRNA dimethylallyltransferase